MGRMRQNPGHHVRFEIDMTTGEVSRYCFTYRVKLKTEAARRLFLDGVGIVYTVIRGCRSRLGNGSIRPYTNWIQ